MTAYTFTDSELEKDFEAILKEKDIRVYVYYVMIARTGYRQGDIIKLRVRDIKGKTSLNMIEEKTGKYREIVVTLELRKIINQYIKDKKDNDFLFQSPRKRKKHLDYTTMYKIMKAAGAELGIYNISTHTGRKTFGHKIYKVNRSVGDAQLMLGHTSITHTQKYVGADNDYRAELMKKAFR